MFGVGVYWLIIIYPISLPLKKIKSWGEGVIFFFTAFYTKPNCGEYVLYMCYAQDFAVSYVYRNIF